MRQDHRFRKQKGAFGRLSGKLTDEQRKMLPMAVIPLIVLVLIVVILVADHKGERSPDADAPSATVAESGPDEGIAALMETEPTESGEEEPAQTEPSAAPQQTEELDEGERANSFASERFRRDAIPEVVVLMEEYFRARTDGDAEAVNRLYGVTEGLSGAELEAQQAKLRSNAKYISSVGNVTTYVMETEAADRFLVYTVADIKFYTAKTRAPMVMWSYVARDAEGGYLLVDARTLTTGELAFVDAANRSDEVRRLASDVNARLREALASDEDLRQVYGVLREGSPVWENTGETEAEVVILDGSESEASGGDETESASGAGETGAATESTSGAGVTEAAPENTSAADETTAATE